ncbi:MAG: hypothetical protein M1833_003725 [Piccolia ochrophora]|nr:MAG: hypothetical protein M1833_003725 [Piccolia ochrophora]
MRSRLSFVHTVFALLGSCIAHPTHDASPASSAILSRRDRGTEGLQLGPECSGDALARVSLAITNLGYTAAAGLNAVKDNVNGVWPENSTFTYFFRGADDVTLVTQYLQAAVDASNGIGPLVQVHCNEDLLENRQKFCDLRHPVYYDSSSFDALKTGHIYVCPDFYSIGENITPCSTQGQPPAGNHTIAGILLQPFIALNAYTSPGVNGMYTTSSQASDCRLGASGNEIYAETINSTYCVSKFADYSWDFGYGAPPAPWSGEKCLNYFQTHEYDEIN